MKKSKIVPGLMREPPRFSSTATAKTRCFIQILIEGCSGFYAKPKTVARKSPLSLAGIVCHKLPRVVTKSSCFLVGFGENEFRLNCPVKITLASVAIRGRSERFDGPAAGYLERLQPYAHIETQIFRTSAALFAWADRLKGRTVPMLVLLDEHGKQLSSTRFAEWLRRQRDEGQQRIVFAIGPADGWSDAERSRAGLLLSLSTLTLPHELARVVISEQVYRAFTILAGHPYHRED